MGAAETPAVAHECTEDWDTDTTNNVSLTTLAEYTQSELKLENGKRMDREEGTGPLASHQGDSEFTPESQDPRSYDTVPQGMYQNKPPRGLN